MIADRTCYWIDNVVVTDAMITASDLDHDTDHGQYASGTTYTVDDEVSDSATGFHYKSVQSSNTGNDLSDTDWWTRQDATPRYKPFDRYIADQASRAESLSFSIRPEVFTDTIALYGVSADTVNILVVSDAAGTVYDETLSLIDTDLYSDWYEYWFNTQSEVNEVLIGPFPPYADGVITLTFTRAGGDAKVGQVDTGMSKPLGVGVAGTSPFFEDFSFKERDTFGRYAVTERAYSNGVDFRLACDPNQIQHVRKTIAGRRATPTTFYIRGTEGMGTLVFGFPNTFAPGLQLGATFFNLRIKGLI